MTEATFNPTEFHYPGAAWRGKLFLLWNGKLEKEEPLRQLHIIKEMGMGGFFMHSRTGLGTEYRILIFPHRFGDPLPTTEWSDDRSRKFLTFLVVGGYWKNQTEVRVYVDGEMIDAKRGKNSDKLKGTVVDLREYQPLGEIALERVAGTVEVDAFTVYKMKSIWR